MYNPLVGALNYALDQLSEFDVPGLPEFQEKRQIVFARSDAKSISSASYLNGSYKPDIVLVKWNMFKKTHQRSDAAYSESYESDICFKSGCDQPALKWHNILSTVEVKRGGSGGTGGSGNERFKGEAKGNSVEYTGDFGELQGDLEAPVSSKPPQPAPSKMVDEEYPIRLRTFVVFHRLSSHSHQLQFRHALA